MSFLAPWFLLGALAIAAPLWLHRLHREDPRRERFSSLMLLEAGSPRMLLSRRLRYFLLLALRCALLVLLALAFAQPAWRRAPAAATEGEARFHIVAIDTSLSMQHETHWQSALSTAASLIDQLPGGDPAMLIAAGDPVRILAGPTADRGALQTALRALQPGAAATDFGAVIGALAGLAREQEGAVRLHFVSDLQQSALPARFADLVPAADTELVLHPVADKAAPNRAITAVRHDRAAAQIVVEVRGFATPEETLTVRAAVEGSDLPRASLALAANGQGLVQFSLPEDRLRQGFNRVQVALGPGDELGADDQAYFVIEHGTRGQILILGAAPNPDDAVYFATAVRAFGDAGIEPVVAAVTTPPGAFAEFAAVVVLDAGALDSTVAADLATYARNGGALLLAAGPRVAGRESWPITGQRIRPVTDGRSALGVGAGDTSHPLLGALDAWRGVRFYRSVLVEPAAEDQVPLRLENGAPLLIETAFGKPSGRVLLFLSSLDTQWNDLALSPAFVAFTGAFIEHIVRGSALPRSAVPGTRLGLPGGGQVFDPDGASVLELSATLGGDARLERLGIHEVRYSGLTALVAVNPAPADADLAPIDEATLARWRAAVAITDRAAPSATGGSLNDNVPAQPATRALLALLLLLAIGETIVGHWHLKIRRELG
jgi:hypothetical protein